MTIEDFRERALSFPDTIEAPHFDRTAFKVIKKRIFATLHEAQREANLKLSEADQAFFCSLSKKAIYPVPNKWGLQGWTTFKLDKVEPGVMLDALNSAFNEVFKVSEKKKVMFISERFRKFVFSLIRIDLSRICMSINRSEFSLKYCSKGSKINFATPQFFRHG